MLDLTNQIFIWCIALVCLATTAYWLLFRPSWMGFTNRTLWDWLVLLAVPAMVGMATIMISAGQLHIESERAEEEAVQNYLDRISELALAGEFARNERQATAVARGHTLAVLRVVNGERAGRILQFLDEIDLLQSLVQDLEDMDLAEAELKGVSLVGINMEGANLAGADLELADLSDANLENANLRETDFKSANLKGADLEGANISDADFRGANLEDVMGLTIAQLMQACLDSATRIPSEISSETVRNCRDDSGDDD